MAAETSIPNAVINTFKTKELYEKAKAQGLLKDGEIHLFPDDSKELSTTEILEIWNSVMND